MTVARALVLYIVAGALVVWAAALACAGCGVAGRSGNADPPQAATPTCHNSAGQQCGLTCCGERCLDPERDPLNCGGCGKVCPAGTACSAGHCGCPPFGSVCGTGQSCCATNGCVSLMNDIRNCGGCGVTCPDGVACVDGSCAGAVTPTPPLPGFCSCASQCSNDPTHTCIAPDCCYQDYVDGHCSPATSCGIWTYK